MRSPHRRRRPSRSSPEACIPIAPSCGRQGNRRHRAGWRTKGVVRSAVAAAGRNQKRRSCRTAGRGRPGLTLAMMRNGKPSGSREPVLRLPTRESAANVGGDFRVPNRGAEASPSHGRRVRCVAVTLVETRSTKISLPAGRSTAGRRSSQLPNRSVWRSDDRAARGIGSSEQRSSPARGSRQGAQARAWMPDPRDP
jgi:hypothetical protein